MNNKTHTETQNLGYDTGNTKPLALVVEDDDMAATLMQLHLERYGFRVVCANTAELALKMVAGEKPDVITLDVMLPGMSGIKLLERIKGNPELAGVPVVVISSIGVPSMSNIAAGAVQVLQKPIRHKELGNVLHTIGFNLKEGRKKSVLVVSDDPAEIQLLDGYLDSTGYQVLRAYNGPEGADKARQFHPDLIILNLTMSAGGGLDMMKTIGNDPGTAVIPFLVLASRPLTENDRAALAVHAVKIMEMPDFNHLHFLNEVKRALTYSGSE